MSDIAAPPAFFRHGPSTPALPVIISVPHAGRYYAPSLIANAAVPMAKLQLLEDRYADLLITEAVERSATAFVAGHARAWIDFNRDPREMDPAMIAGPPPPGLISSMRTRHGLGLIPRRMGDSTGLWRSKLEAGDVTNRIDAFHRPYHQALADALASARAQFGIAILLDCHSMPPIKREQGASGPAIVIGDRFGRSAGSGFGDLIENIASRAGYACARNAPYAGGHCLDLHGKPRAGIHALQIEIDRSRYLDASLDQPGEGLEATRDLVTAIFDALCVECRPPAAIAAE